MPVCSILTAEGEGQIARFLDRNGPGLQQLAYRVSDIEAVSELLRARGVEPDPTDAARDDAPRAGRGASITITTVAPARLWSSMMSISSRRLTGSSAGSVSTALYRRGITDSFLRIFAIDDSNPNYDIVNRMYQNAGNSRQTGVQILLEHRVLQLCSTQAKAFGVSRIPGGDAEDVYQVQLRAGLIGQFSRGEAVLDRQVDLFAQRAAGRDELPVAPALGARSGAASPH